MPIIHSDVDFFHPHQEQAAALTRANKKQNEFVCDSTWECWLDLLAYQHECSYRPAPGTEEHI
jgi:hypothetical protein